MSKVEIKEAMLVELDTDNNCKEELCDTLYFTNIKTINCVVDKERGNVIDIETGFVYHIIKREQWGIISREEAQNIRNSESGTMFVYGYYSKDMQNISLLYQMVLKSRAQKKYQEYLEGINQEKGKTFAKTKKQEK